VPIKRALIRVVFLFDHIVVIAEKALSRHHVDLAFILPHQLLPAGVPRHGALRKILGIEVCLLANEFFADREIRSNKVAVISALQCDVL
jgi:hypothetical protein